MPPHNPDRLYRGPVGVVLEPAVRVLRGHGLAQHKAVWWAHRAVWRLTRSNRVRIDGFDLETDLHDSLQLARGAYEVAETAWYKAHVGPGDTVVELGANIGYFTCVFARSVGPTGRVVAYEPDPRLREIATRNLESHGFGGWSEVRPSAVSDGPGRATFYRAGRNYGNNSLFRDRADAIGGSTFEVDLVTLDDDLADLPDRIDFVKMDIQGAESHALSGMDKILADRPPRLMLLEFWPHGLDALGRPPRQMLDQLADAGYTVREMGRPDPVDPDALLARLTPESRMWTNLECHHRDA
ncbi:FkbM family methyltransferase [Nocardioides sp. SYSU D00038]|uniref:FkbM family methyltransferase n=1 Tax=Nocardioides sp. SYSU D00038 TaxID=2812554 RepID=UPI001967318C|nr:FkbM family methyltransferase [Nocardioides sp. SYSU D00038]